MALIVYEKVGLSFVPLGDSVRTTHDGFRGSIDEKIFYIRNDDALKYYTEVQCLVQMLVYLDWGEFGDTGWSIKLIQGERRPTEMEWNEVLSGQTIYLPDIGTTDAGNTDTYFPVWIRVVCPGGTPAQLRENIKVLIRSLPVMVGS